MNKYTAKSIMREKMRLKYGFSPHWKDITIIKWDVDDQDYFHAIVAVEELIERQGLIEVRAPKHYYKFEYDGIYIEKTDEEGRVLNEAC